MMIEIEKTKPGDHIRLALDALTWRLTQSPVTSRVYGGEVRSVTYNGKPSVEVHADEYLSGGGVEKIKAYLDPGQVVLRVEVRDDG